MSLNSYISSFKCRLLSSVLPKKYILILLSICLFQLILVLSVLLTVDPMHLFRASLPNGQLPQTAPQRFQNAAIAKTYGKRYDAIIMGTSMTENFSADELKEKLGIRAMNLAMSGAELDEMLLVLDYAFVRNPQIKTVIWGIQPNHIFSEINVPSKDKGFPTYLYNDSEIDDLLAYVGKRFFLKQRSKDDDNIWNWYEIYKDKGDFSRAHYFETACGILTGTEKTPSRHPSRINNIIQIVTAHPAITFYILIPPRSALLLKAQADNYYAGITEYAKLLEYSNVRVFDFTQMRSLTMNISRYKDLGHYDSDGNSSMVSAFATGAFEMTKDSLSSSQKSILQYKDASLSDIGITDDDIANYCQSES